VAPPLELLRGATGKAQALPEVTSVETRRKGSSVTGAAPSKSTRPRRLPVPKDIEDLS
jgi:hypothetical protein